MNYRETRNAYCNCNKRIFKGVGPYDIPKILPQEIDLTDPKIIGFNYAKGEDFPEEEICHFYLDDYQFDRVWTNPENYVDLMRKFKAVLAPDFSLYDDFPVAVNLYNHYRKHWIARYWQENGITVIPTICWADNAMDWCFDGTPKHSTVSISTVGCNKGDGRDYWTGFNKAIEVLQPSRILLFTSNSPVKLPKLDCEVVRVVSGNLAGAKQYTSMMKSLNALTSGASV